LLTVLEPGGTRVTMTYDGDLKRRKRAEGSGWTTYLWDREQVLIEMNKNNVTQVRYTQAPRGYGDVVSQRRSSASTFWHFDAIGSMRFLTAADQSKAINYVYDAFGITRSVSGTTTNRFRYIGRLGYYLEPALGCYYLRRRYYVHWLGRFLSKDPVRDGGENAYVYVGNRPGRATDPSGRVSCGLRCAPLLALGPLIGGILYAECVVGCQRQTGCFTPCPAPLGAGELWDLLKKVIEIGGDLPPVGIGDTACDAPQKVQLADQICEDARERVSDPNATLADKETSALLCCLAIADAGGMDQAKAAPVCQKLIRDMFGGV